MSQRTPTATSDFGRDPAGPAGPVQSSELESRMGVQNQKLARVRSWSSEPETGQSPELEFRTRNWPESGAGLQNQKLARIRSWSSGLGIWPESRAGVQNQKLARVRSWSSGLEIWPEAGPVRSGSGVREEENTSRYPSPYPSRLRTGGHPERRNIRRLTHAEGNPAWDHGTWEPTPPPSSRKQA